MPRSRKDVADILRGSDRARAMARAANRAGVKAERSSATVTPTTRFSPCGLIKPPGKRHRPNPVLPVKRGGAGLDVRPGGAEELLADEQATVSCLLINAESKLADKRTRY